MYKPTKKADAYNADLIGISLLAISLVFDGFSQTETDKKFRDSKRDFAYPGMLGNNLVGLTFYVGIYGYRMYTEGDDTLARILNNPQLLQDCVIFALAGAMGQVFIFFTISVFDCYLVTIILTCQKFISIVYSNIRFGHQFNSMQWFGFSIVTTSGIIEMILKQSNKQKKD